MVGAHTERQKVVDECHRTSQRAVAGGTLVILWEPLTGYLLKSWGGLGHEVAESSHVWAQCPGYKNKPTLLNIFPTSDVSCVVLFNRANNFTE